MEKLVVLGICLVIALYLHSFRHVLPTSIEGEHARLSRSILSTAMKEMGEGYDIAHVADGNVSIPARVMQYVKETGNNPVELGIGWCSSFSSWVLKENGCKYPRGNTDYEWQMCLERTDNPSIGDIAMCLQHVAIVHDFFYDHFGTKMINIVGGAQVGRVCLLSIPANHVMWFGRGVKAPKGWAPTPTIQQLRDEDDLVTVKRPEPLFDYPEHK